MACFTNTFIPNYLGVKYISHHKLDPRRCEVVYRLDRQIFLSDTQCLLMELVLLVMWMDRQVSVCYTFGVHVKILRFSQGS